MHELTYMAYVVYKYRRGRPNAPMKEASFSLWFTNKDVAAVAFKNMTAAANVVRGTLWDKSDNTLLREYNRT